MRVLGIDPGLGGALALLSSESGFVAACPMPLVGGELDYPAIADFLRDFDPDLVVMERVHSHPKQGVASTFKFGEGFGGIRGVCGALGFRLELALPTTWKAAVLAGTAKDKAAAVAYVRRAFPDAPLFVSARSRVPHTGIADALCLAAYGLRTFQRPE